MTTRSTKTSKTPRATAKSKGRIRDVYLQKVGDMGLPETRLKRATPRVKDLNVRDLNDLALSFSGVEVQNTKLRALKVEDLQSLEDVFIDFKQTSLGRIQNATSFNDIANTLVDIDISCCCCTPCCCCAAATVDPFAA